MPSDFQTVAHKPRCYSFGLSRAQCAKRAIEGHFQPDPKVPGPGTYSLPPKVGEGVRYSFREKQLKPQVQNGTPGPGAYSPCFENPPGHYRLSTCKSAGHMSFSPRTLARFPKLAAGETPGPGTYFAERGETAKGGKISSLSSRDFFPRINSATPGPGTYSLPGGFGPMGATH